MLIIDPIIYKKNLHSGNNRIMALVLHRIYVNEPKPNNRDVIKDDIWCSPS